MNETRQKIIRSLFADPSQELSYESHVKIWEDDDSGGRKPRFIVLAYNAPTDKGKVYKTKLNTSGTYSVGKTWELDSLRGLEVYDPVHFDVTLARRYRWNSESPTEQAHFLNAIVALFHKTNPGKGLPIAGNMPAVPQSQPSAPQVRQPPPSAAPSTSSRTFIPNHNDQSAPQSLQPGPPPTTRKISGHSRNGSASSGIGVPPSPSFPPSSARRVNGYGVSDRPTSPTGSAYTSASAGDLRSPSPTGRRKIRPSLPSDEPQQRVLSQSKSASGLRPHERNPSVRTNGSTPPPPLPSASTTSSFGRPAMRSPPSSLRGSISSPFVGSPPDRESFTVPSRLRANGVPAAPISAQDVFQQEPSRTSFDKSQSRPSSPPPSRLKASMRAVSPTPPRAPSPPTSVASASTRQQRSKPPSPERRPTTKPRPEPVSRVTYFDAPNQSTAERLLSTGADDDNDEEEELEETLANVEEILEGYEWVDSDLSVSRRGNKAAADQIEARLISELNALEKANTHSFIESDDRTAALMELIEEAVNQLDQMDSLLQSYKIHLNVVGDDISHIQSQNRGLQVQTQNQRALLEELEQILQTVNVDPDVLIILTQERLDSTNGLQRLEGAAAELYKALQASRDRDMAASMDRLDEYKTYNRQFCQRISEFLQIMIPAQSQYLLDDNPSKGSRSKLTLQDHKKMEKGLESYSGLVLYLKEMDEDRYGKLCALYFGTVSELHKKQMTTMLLNYAALVKKAAEEDNESVFVVSPKDKPAGGLRRAGTKSDRKDRAKDSEGEMRGYEALGSMLDQLGRQVYREEEFLADFLQINEAALTFADYMNLESYFRRQAAQFAALGPTTSKLVRGAMDLIFGFLPEELKQWVDAALQRDNVQIAGILASLERFLAETDERSNTFFVRMVEKLHVRAKALFERHVGEQIKAVEKTKLNAKKRRGVAYFIKFFPVYVQRMETQLIGANDLEIRTSVDDAFERLVDTMFEALQQMAKLDGGGEDKEKGQLNYHVILIENMHFFLHEMSQIELGSVGPFSRRAQGIYDENLQAYIKIVMRRPFSKIIDFFDGVERQLQTTAPTEIPNNTVYSKSSLKRVLKEYDSKDIKRAVDTLYKRVEKHFSDEDSSVPAQANNTTLSEVWKAIEEETLRATNRFNDFIGQCYGGTGLTLEYTVSDVKNSYKRHV